MSKFIPPQLNVVAFNCTRCRVYASQQWYFLRGAEDQNGCGIQYSNHEFMVSDCSHCRSPTIWHGDTMIYPLNSNTEPPNPDLPSNVLEDFEEASKIANLSPRGAAALLRLGIQKLCVTLGATGSHINNDIALLVSNGLPQSVQQALDIVRVIGNEAVHPGVLDLKDDRQTVNSLFSLVNFIAEKMITEPRKLAELYRALPPEKVAAIEKRDSKT